MTDERTDSAGRDVTDLPGLWSEEDEPVALRNLRRVIERYKYFGPATALVEVAIGELRALLAGWDADRSLAAKLRRLRDTDVAQIARLERQTEKDRAEIEDLRRRLAWGNVVPTEAYDRLEAALGKREAVVEAARQAEQAFEYIHAPTMGLPPGADPEEWARDGCSDEDAHLALATCISIATAERERIKPALAALDEGKEE